MVEVKHIRDDDSTAFQRRINEHIRKMDEEGKRLIDIKHSCAMENTPYALRYLYSAVLMFDAGPADILAQPTE